MNNHKFIILCIFSFLLFISSCTSHFGETKIKDQRSAAQWYQQGRAKVLQRQHNLLQNIRKQNKTGQSKAKNIIFVLGDGMGISTLTAARIFVGQQQGLLGEEFALSFEAFPHSALIKTYNVDLQTPDSAGTMSALMTGVKTNEGIISLPDSVKRGDCSSMVDKILPTLMDIAKEKGKSTAMITTARVTHATPATTYAHSVERNWESDETMSSSAKGLGCRDIATQFIAAQGASLDILFGGGRRHFLSIEEGGKRTDNRNLIKEWQQQGEYVGSLNELNQLGAAEDKGKPWLGLFSSSHMGYAYQRPAEQPSLQQMVAVALQRLQQDEQGYSLVIEAGRIDHGHHGGTAYKALSETQELHETVAWLLTQVDLNETLIVVTADHSHTLTLGGDATRGNPILGPMIGNDAKGYPNRNVSVDKNGHTYTSLTYRDGPGAMIARDDLVDHYQQPDYQQPEYQQVALVPMDYETHAGEDVALYAIGPQARLFSGTLEQHWVFHALKYAMQ